MTKPAPKKKNRKKPISFFSFDVINKMLLVLIAAAGIYFIISINDISIKGFVLRELKTQINDLRKENENLEIAIMKLESLENIRKRADEMKMVKVDKIEYISIADEAVAIK